MNGTHQKYALHCDQVTEVDLGPFGRALVTSTVPFKFGDCLFAEGTRHSVGGNANRGALFKACGRVAGELTVSPSRPTRAPTLPPLHHDA